MIDAAARARLLQDWLQRNLDFGPAINADIRVCFALDEWALADSAVERYVRGAVELDDEELADAINTDLRALLARVHSHYNNRWWRQTVTPDMPLLYQRAFDDSLRLAEAICGTDVVFDMCSTCHPTSSATAAWICWRTFR